MLSGSRIGRQCLLRPGFARLRMNFGHGDGGPNAEILEMLRNNERAENSKPLAERNPYKVRAFSEAIQIIGNLEYAITSAKDAKRLRGVGDGIAQRIGELLQPPPSEPLVLPEQPSKRVVPIPSPPKKVESSVPRDAVREISKVPKIGPTKAKQLVQAGCITIPMLMLPRYFAMLSSAQQTSAMYYEELQQMATQADAKAVVDFMNHNLSSEYEVMLAGSFRRGHAQSSEIEIALFHPSHIHVPLPAAPTLDSPEMQKGLLDRRGRQIEPFQDKSVYSKQAKTSLLSTDVIPALTARGLLASTFMFGNTKWQGIVRVPEATPQDALDRIEAREGRLAAIKNREGSFRRVDISLVPMRSRGSGLLALTGDANFFRHLRNKAKGLGLHLNEYGLWKWNPSGTRIEKQPRGRPKAVVGRAAKINNITSGTGFWELLELSTEEEIMAELGMEFVIPNRRNFNYIVTS